MRNYFIWQGYVCPRAFVQVLYLIEELIHPDPVLHIPPLNMFFLLQLVESYVLIFEGTLQLISSSIIAHTLLGHEVMDPLKLLCLLLNESAHQIEAKIQIIQLLHVIEVEFNA